VKSALVFQIALFLYLLGTAASISYLISLRRRLFTVTILSLVAGFVIHTLAILLRYAEAGQVPITNLHEALSFFSWCIVGIYLLLQIRYRVDVLAAFISPVASAMIILASFFPKEIIPVAPVLKSFWLPVHVFFAFAGNGMFALAFAAGVMYLIQERHIKRKKIGAFYRRLPALRVLDELNYRCLTIGFPLLTMGIITGSVWAETAWGSYWNWDPKETWSLITWFLYAALLHGRLTVGWRGKRAAIFAIIGFSALVFTFLGVNLLLSGQHTFR
jgi:cytochrome c-type biogenesis protein CcsB